MWLNGACCKGYVRGSCRWQSPVPNQYEDNDLSTQSVHSAFPYSCKLNRPSFRSSNRQGEQKVLGAYCRSGVKKHIVLILISAELELWHVSTLFPCLQHPAGLWFWQTLSGHAARASQSCGWIWFVQSQQQDSKTVVKHGGPVVFSGVTQEQDGLLAGRQHIAPQPLSVPADSPLYPEVFSFTQNKEPELAGIMSNITI